MLFFSERSTGVGKGKEKGNGSVSTGKVNLWHKPRRKPDLLCIVILNNKVLRLPAIVLLNTVFNKTIAGRRRTLLLNVKPARMSVKNCHCRSESIL